MKRKRKEPNRPIKYHYIFKFSDGASTSVEVYLDPRTMDCIVPQIDPPEWVLLTYNQCSNCPLDSKEMLYCPVAYNIASLVETFRDCSSHETTQVIILTKQRDYIRHTTLQEGLTALMGLYMASSACPVMGKLKPLVRFHLPFASLEENVFRVASMYLLIQYFMKKRGKEPDWELAELPKIYEEIQKVNNGVLRRLKSAAQKDASLTAVTNLDYMASLLPFVIHDTLELIEPALQSYFKE